VTLFLERTPGAVKGGQPLPGAHTEEVLTALGRSEAEIAALRAGGVV
jgi:crotonobetainyl-CoA:carnitine CoA-transferase CaiB-like acyl-CoA transferase